MRVTLIWTENRTLNLLLWCRPLHHSTYIYLKGTSVIVTHRWSFLNPQLYLLFNLKIFWHNLQANGSPALNLQKTQVNLFYRLSYILFTATPVTFLTQNKSHTCISNFRSILLFWESFYTSLNISPPTNCKISCYFLLSHSKYCD